MLAFYISIPHHGGLQILGTETSSFHGFDLRVVSPAFDSALMESLTKLEGLRHMHLGIGASTRPELFFDLKTIFHLLESLGSARIEGNNTTISELVENRIFEDAVDAATANFMEISNVENAMCFIDEHVEQGQSITRPLLLELHKLAVDGLPLPPQGEGDSTPGEYRKAQVNISNSAHMPPFDPQPYMQELLDFINAECRIQVDLLKIALAHHRFTWVHPFNNGNGRVVRLLTYAMLIQKGFNVRSGRILNPSAIFCGDRTLYNERLAGADTGTDEGLLTWCEYVTKGLQVEIQKIDQLLNHDFLRDRIIMPAIKMAHDHKSISEVDAKILEVGAKKQVFKAADIKDILPSEHAADRSRRLARLKEMKLIRPSKGAQRTYILNLSTGILLRGVIRALGDEGMIPIPDEP